MWVQMLAELFVGLGASSISIDNELSWKKVFFVKVEEAGVDLFLGQIPAGTYHNDRENLL